MRITAALGGPLVGFKNSSGTTVGNVTPQIILTTRTGGPVLSCACLDAYDGGGGFFIQLDTSKRGQVAQSFFQSVTVNGHTFHTKDAAFTASANFASWLWASAANLFAGVSYDIEFS